MRRTHLDLRQALEQRPGRTQLGMVLLELLERLLVLRMSLGRTAPRNAPG